MKRFGRILITLVIVGAVLFAIAKVLKSNKEKNDAKVAVVAQGTGAISVRVDTVKKQVADIDFSVNGNFAAAQEIKFSAEFAGRVTRVLVDEGSRVTRGQVLATIKTDQLSVDLENARAVYANAQSDLQRYENAFKTGGVTKQQLDQARLSVENAKARLSAASIKIGDANIRASINGIVNKRYIEPGAVLAPGSAMFDIVDVSRLKLNVTVNEAQVANLKNGDAVTISSTVFPDKQFAGKITFIAPKADNALNFPIEIEVANSADRLLRAGMYGTATFAFPKQAPALIVPRAAFVGSVASNQVFVVQDSIARLKKVVAGRILGDRVEVASGLQENEQVIVSGQVNLADGSKVEVIR
jgi:RND family efflux transporter MFP subunit